MHKKINGKQAKSIAALPLNITSSIMQQPFSFTSYMLRHPTSGQYSDVCARVLKHERIERVLTDCAREELHDQCRDNAYTGQSGLPYPRNTADLANYEKSFAKKLASKRASAVRMLQQMRTGISACLLRLAGWILIKLLSRVFSHVRYNAAEVEALRAAQKKDVPLVYLPMHRSHLDYILISFVLYLKGLQPPLVAAGDNLNIPVFGNLMRGLGAFFIRRRMEDPAKGRRDMLYRTLLQVYISENLRASHPIEFFIEAGRSRTGKALMPKAGLLSIVVDAILNNTVPDVLLAPVGVSYEKLVDGSFITEQLGGTKKSESFFMAICSIWRKLTGGRFGDVRITFSQPFSLKQFIYRSLVDIPNLSQICDNNISMDSKSLSKDLFEEMKTPKSHKKGRLNKLQPPHTSYTQSVNIFSRYSSSVCAVCTNQVSSRDLAPIMLSVEQRRIVIQKLADHVTYTAFNACAIMGTHALSTLLLYKYRKGCTLKQLSESYEELRELLVTRNREWTNQEPDSMLNSLQLLGKENIQRLSVRLQRSLSSESELCSLSDSGSSPPNSPALSTCSSSGYGSNAPSITYTPSSDSALMFIRPHTRASAILQLHYYANNCIGAFALDSALASAICGECEMTGESLGLQRSSLDSGVGMETNSTLYVRLSRHECILRTMRLCELLRFEYIFAPSCVQLQQTIEAVFDEFVSNGLLQKVQLSAFELAQAGRRPRQPETGDDKKITSTEQRKQYIYQVNELNVDTLRFFQQMAVPLLHSYWLVGKCLHKLKTAPMEEKRFLLHVLDYGREFLDNGQLQFEESLSMDPLRNALKLFEAEQIIHLDECVGGRRVSLQSRYHNEEKIKRYLHSTLEPYLV